MYDEIITEKERNFIPQDLEVKLYKDNYHQYITMRRDLKRIYDNIILNEDGLKKNESSDINKENKLTYSSINKIEKSEDYGGYNEGGNFEENEKINQIIERYNQKKGGERLIENAYVTMLFRLFIWRDMLREMKKERAFLGINFGKPQRSKSIEILGWARDEWTRDGWITPHNLYIHLFYRAGIVGLGGICVVFILLIRMIKDFYLQSNITGGILISVIIYWLLIAAFLVFLEFPYGAIPFWSVFGMTFAYYQNKKNEIKYENSSYP
ncbi:MAG: O-antigen ligase family protein [Candidatus Omnitrophica bacterium]|nr:O-antigen ligase family protein [Candidatus Omnitrophota bacterium]